MAGALLVAIGLAHAMLFIQQAFPGFATPTWRAAACLHTVLGLLAWLFWNVLRQRIDVSPAKVAALQQRWPRLTALQALIPSVLVLGFCGLLAFGGGAKVKGLWSIPQEHRYWILWVPFIEEWTYRVGLGAFIRGRIGATWGCYVSALLFAFVHSLPTVPHLLEGKFAIPLGPFLLGWINEWIYLKTGRIWPAIIFHMACNGTAVIFLIGDHRWLKWLGIFYT